MKKNNLTKNKQTQNNQTKNKQTQNKQTQNKQTQNKQTQNKQTQNKQKINKLQTSQTQNNFSETILTKLVLPSTKIISMGMFFEKEKIFVIGDLHIGQEEEFNKKGILVPRNNFKKIINELKFVFKQVNEKNESNKKLNKIILLGDVKHEFGENNNQEWVEIIQLIDFLKEHANEIIVVKGNHDNFIEAITKWKNFKVVNKFEINNYCFCHGDKIIETNKKNIVIGHEHSAITLNDDYKKEKFKCIAKTSFKEKNIIVLPSFSFFSIGVDVLREKLISPYLKNSKKFEVWLIEKRQNFYFGELNIKM